MSSSVSPTLAYISVIIRCIVGIRYDTKSTSLCGNDSSFCKLLFECNKLKER